LIFCIGNNYNSNLGILSVLNNIIDNNNNYVIKYIELNNIMVINNNFNLYFVIISNEMPVK